MKKIGISLLLLVALLTVTACESKESTTSSKNQIHEHCTRTGIVTNGEANLNYEVYYTGDRINKIESTERVSSESSDVLDTYEDAYRNIHEQYKGLKYYDTEVIRTDSSVTSKITIDYDHIDIDALITLEGVGENSIFENKIPKISKYKEFGEKIGLSCTPVN